MRVAVLLHDAGCYELHYGSQWLSVDMMEYREPQKTSEALTRFYNHK